MTKPILDAFAVGEMLRATQGYLCQGPLSTDDVIDAARAADSWLDTVGLTVSQRRGAVVDVRSGKSHGTRMTIVRELTGWIPTDVHREFYDSSARGAGLFLTERQIAMLISRFGGRLPLAPRR